MALHILPRGQMPDILTLSDSGDSPPPGAFGWARSAAYAHIELAPHGHARNLWAAKLDEAVRLAERPVVIVAFGVSCFALAWWARLTPASYLEQVAGALMIAPLGASVIAARGAENFAGPDTRFSFPSLVIEEADTDARAEGLAASWGSRLLDLRNLGQPLHSIGARVKAEGEQLLERIAGALPAIGQRMA
jgi:predicted alpha/beta hydrolase family esterase